MAAPVLEGSVRTFTPKTITRNLLDTPYQRSWPLLEKGVTPEILNKLKSELGGVSTYLRKVTSKGKRKRATAAEDAGKASLSMEEQEMARQLKAQLTLGINEVTKALEKDRLRLVLVCRSVKPALMTDHLILLSAVRRVPALCLSGLSETVAPILNFRTVAAMGFKKTSPDDNTTFDPLVDFVSARTPPIKISWLKLQGVEGSEKSSEDEAETKDSSDEDLVGKVGSGSGVDETSVTVTEDIPQSEISGDFIPLVKDEDQSRDAEKTKELQREDSGKKAKKSLVKRKKRKMETELDECDEEESGYQDLCVKRTQWVQEKAPRKKKMVYKKKKKTVQV